MCLLIQPYSLISSSCSSEPTAQFGLLQSLGHPNQPCHLLYLGALLPRIWVLHPLGHSSFKRTIIYHSRHTQNVWFIAADFPMGKSAAAEQWSLLFYYLSVRMNETIHETLASINEKS